MISARITHAENAMRHPRRCVVISQGLGPRGVLCGQTRHLAKGTCVLVQQVGTPISQGQTFEVHLPLLVMKLAHVQKYGL